MDFTISPSPTYQIVFSRYDAALFPKFESVFKPAQTQGAFHLLAQPPAEAERALVMVNCGEKDVTALRYHWVMTDQHGKVEKSTVSLDSYQIEGNHAVLRVKESKLVSRFGAVDESLIDHARAGGGVIAGGINNRESIVGMTSLLFDVDMLLFADGEIVGSDTGKFALELRCRQRAAEFVARQIQLGEAESRDVAPVLSALAEIPVLRDRTYPHGDFVASWVRRYARECLRAIHHNSVVWTTIVRRLANHATLPKFYRNAGTAEGDSLN